MTVSERFATSVSEGIGATAPCHSAPISPAATKLYQHGRIAVDDDRSNLCDLCGGPEEHFGRTFRRPDADLLAIKVGERFDRAPTQRCDLERGFVHRKQRAQVLLRVPVT